MQEAFGIVLIVVVAAGAVTAVLTLFSNGRMYDRIGRGGLSIEEKPPPAPERDAEIRQMLAARNAVRAERGAPPLDVDAEFGRLSVPAADEGLRTEIRQLVEARNARRLARGEAPLDVEAEVEREVNRS